MLLFISILNFGYNHRHNILLKRLDLDIFIWNQIGIIGDQICVVKKKSTHFVLYFNSIAKLICFDAYIYMFIAIGQFLWYQTKPLMYSFRSHKIEFVYFSIFDAFN